ncbi:MAG TPA: Crp/Fnr family transcriptional regulator [Ferruginibacter sp.]|nr:Crp/Fnr family transcriptional regulator [Ferruginibacter sp.]
MILDIDLLLALGATYKKLSAGETIFLEGTHCSFYHQLVSGRVKWVNINDDGKEFIHTIIEPGESFGELPLFDDEPYAANAIAEEDSIILRLHKPVFLNLLKETPDLHFTFSRLLAEKVRFKLLLLKTISCEDPVKCISTLLAYLKKNKKNMCGDCNQVKLTRQQIAGMTGLRVETVIRAMRTMHDKGDLVISKGKVYC